MRQKSGVTKDRAEKVVKDIRRATRWRFSAEDKIRIVLADRLYLLQDHRLGLVLSVDHP